MFFSFFTRNTLRENLFLLNVCQALAKRERCKLQAPIYKAWILARMLHTSVTCDWLYHFSHTWRNIVCSPDLPELICVWKTCDIVFWWVFLSTYIIKLYSHLCEQIYVCFVFPIQTTWFSLGNLLCLSINYVQICAWMGRSLKKFSGARSRDLIEQTKQISWKGLFDIGFWESKWISAIWKGLCCCVDWEWNTFKKESSTYYLYFFK